MYLATGQRREDTERNDKITKKIEEHVDKTECNENMILMGDFNGHLDFLGNQNCDRNGKFVKKLMDEKDLILLNIEEECEGIVTWEKKDMKSTIDFLLVNRELYKRFGNMKIDEKKQIFDQSDHNLLSASFRWNTYVSKKTDEDNTRIKTYLTMNEDALKEYTKEMEKMIEHNRTTDIGEFNKLIQTAADKTLKRKRKTQNNKKDGSECLWITKEIKTGIKERKKINRERRNETNERKREVLWEKYIEKKVEVQRKIREAVTKHEKKVTEDIRKDNKKMWMNINTLRGNKNKNEEFDVFDTNGKKLEEQEASEEITRFWTKIYAKHENKISQEWNDEEKSRYTSNNVIENGEVNDNQEGGDKRNWNKYPPELTDHMGLFRKPEDIQYPQEIREHMDMTIMTFPIREKMKDVDITVDKVRKVVSNIKCGKAPGPDGIKGELYKDLAGNKTCLETLTKCFREEIEREEKPEEWKISKTKLLKKKNKPTAKDLRPLALTDISYKIFMSLLKEEIEEHLINIKEDNELQAGFKKGGRIEDNLLTLRYCVKDAYKRRKQLVITAIDFKKAYDSIKREELVKAMKDYKINEKVIDVVCKIYTGDRVKLTTGKDVNGEIIATSGIRQGCTLSTTLFKLITFKIIENIDKRVKGYSNEDLAIKTLFYADDGLLFSTSIKENRKDVEIMETECKRYGLEINREKSNIIIFNQKDKPNEIGGIQVVKQIKYLGIWVNDEKDMFKIHRQKKLESLERLTNMTHGIVKKACNRLIIGKTYFKSIVIPNVLYGSAVIDWNRKEERVLQTKQNEVCRKLLNAPKFCAVAALKGDIGLSDMKTRLMQSRLQYINNIEKRENELLKKVLQGLDLVDKEWKNRTEEYSTSAELEKGKKYTNVDIKRKCREWDTKKWEKELEAKKSLEIYRASKTEIREEKIYYNDIKSETWFKARANCLDLNGKKWKENKSCLMCGGEKEDIGHFILHCKYLSELRVHAFALQYPIRQHDSETLQLFLFDEEETDRKKDVLLKMWKCREKFINSNINISHNNEQG